MRKLFFTLVIAFGLLTTANAQNEKKMWAGGTVGFSSTKIDKTQSALSYKILPEFGYVLNQNLAIGTSLGYSYSNYEKKSNGQKYYGDKSKAFSVAPFLRYTFMKGNIGGLFLDAGVGYTYDTGTISDLAKYLNTGLTYFIKKETNSHIVEVGIRPGVYVAISKKINLLGKFGFIGYEHTNRSITETDIKPSDSIKQKKNTFNANFDMSELLMGVNILF